MKSTNLQLLVTLAATLAATLMLATKGLPPTTDLETAIARKDVAQIRRALAWGADVNADLIFGKTMLHEVVTKNARDVAELLIDYGADVDACTNNGETPLTLGGGLRKSRCHPAIDQPWS